MPEPVGLPDAEIIKQLAVIEAIGEMSIPPIPPAALQIILDKARAKMTLRPGP